MLHRHFDAPPEEVFAAFTDARLVKKWLGSKAHPLEDAVIEAVPGGRIRQVWGGDPGALLTGEVLRIDPPHRIVHSERCSEAPETGETVVDIRLVPEGPGTVMWMEIAYRDEAARESAMGSPMAEGLELAFGRLDQLLAG